MSRLSTERSVDEPYIGRFPSCTARRSRCHVLLSARNVEYRLLACILAGNQRDCRLYGRLGSRFPCVSFPVRPAMDKILARSSSGIRDWCRDVADVWCGLHCFARSQSHLRHSRCDERSKCAPGRTLAWRCSWFSHRRDILAHRAPRSVVRWTNQGRTDRRVKPMYVSQVDFGQLRPHLVLGASALTSSSRIRASIVLRDIRRGMCESFELPASFLEVLAERLRIVDIILGFQCLSGMTSSVAKWHRTNVRPSLR